MHEFEEIKQMEEKKLKKKKDSEMNNLDWIEYSNQLERALKEMELENKKLMNHNFVLFKLTQ